MSNQAEELPQIVKEAVLVESVAESSITSKTVKGYDFQSALDPNEGKVDYEALLNSYATSGFQAQNYGLVIEEINKMLDWSLADEEVAPDEDAEFTSKEGNSKRSRTRTKIFLAYTSNLISSGLRETLRYLVQNRMVQVITSSAGGIEEDLIKCLADTHMGEHMGGFGADGVALRKQGLNRIGNLIVPNENYCKFEDWMKPLLNTMHDEQDAENEIRMTQYAKDSQMWEAKEASGKPHYGEKPTFIPFSWTPSTMIRRFGKEIGLYCAEHDRPQSSVAYWAYKNDIPTFCPSITDGSIGDMLYFHSYSRPGLQLDLTQDIRKMNDEPVNARKTGVIILGGGMVKHHTMNANLMRNGCDFCVYISTAQEFDGSDSGARPDEAKSWGKIRIDARPVKLYTEATLVLPLIVAQTFAKKHGEFRANLKAAGVVGEDGSYDSAGETVYDNGGEDESRGGFIYHKGYTAFEHEIERKKCCTDEASTAALSQ